MRRALALLLFACCATAFGATQGGPIPVPLPLFPANNWWNTDVSHAPLDASSATFIGFIGTTRRVHPDWGGDNDPVAGTIYGFPYIIVDGAQTKITVMFGASPDESDGVNHVTNTSFPFYPIPPEAITTPKWIEDGPPGNVDDRANSDRHMLIVDKTNNTLYELYHVFYDGTHWTADSGAFFDMNTNNRRTEGWTSADAAGLAILPGLVRYDEVYGPNEITHAFRFTVRDSNGHVFPASHTAGTRPTAPPMGARLRLKSGYDISGLPADVQKICRALKKYGLILADNGSDMYIQGNYDNNWNMDTFTNPSTGLAKLTANDFEVVQQGWQPAVNFILTLPAAMGANDAADATLTAYDSSYNLATGYRGTVTFSSTDGAAALPANYTFTAGDNGSHTFPLGVTLRTAGGQTVYATDTVDATITVSRNVIVGPSTPTGLTATATTDTNVNLTWTASPTGTQYEILRASAGVPYGSLTTVATTSYSDTTVTALHSYVYKVRAIDASMRLSPLSLPDVATTLFFTNDPLPANGTVAVQAAHFTQLRQAINLERAIMNLGDFAFTDPNLSNLTIQAVHMQQLRDALTPARTSLGLPAIVYHDATLTGATIKAIHVQELRDGVK
jgi:hypothetical protein